MLSISDDTWCQGTGFKLWVLPLSTEIPKLQAAESWEDVPVKQPLSTCSFSYTLSQNICYWSPSDAGYWAKMSFGLA